MGFRVNGLSPDGFIHLYGLTDDELAKHGAVRYIVDETPGFPDRIEMRDDEIGDKMLLINHVSQAADTPYRASHAIFVREGALEQYSATNVIPEVMRIRLLSLRAFDDGGDMLDAEIAKGLDIEPIIERLFSNNDVSYIHVHNATRGCYSGRIDREK